MKYLWLFTLATVLFIPTLIGSLLTTPIGYTSSRLCSTCRGEGSCTCDSCHGSGVCWVCEGTGKIWYMNDEWCYACSGSGKCRSCGGSGVEICGACGGKGVITLRMYTVAGAAIATSLISIVLFLAFFGSSYFFFSLQLSFNEWIYEVENMGFWFNRSFMVWLLAKHPKRWLRWQTAANVVLAAYFGILVFWIFSSELVVFETAVLGAGTSIAITMTFSFSFYKSIASRIGVIAS